VDRPGYLSGSHCRLLLLLDVLERIADISRIARRYAQGSRSRAGRTRASPTTTRWRMGCDPGAHLRVRHVIEPGRALVQEILSLPLEVPIIETAGKLRGKPAATSAISTGAITGAPTTGGTAAGATPSSVTTGGAAYIAGNGHLIAGRLNAHVPERLHPPISVYSVLPLIDAAAPCVVGRAEIAGAIDVGTGASTIGSSASTRLCGHRSSHWCAAEYAALCGLLWRSKHARHILLLAEKAKAWINRHFLILAIRGKDVA
jgi:hypothetical protein